MRTVFHAADTRGTTKLNWLESKHTFSFGDYYCPERIRFGTLRVLNDDVVKPGMGFGTHPHQNMEIISIPLRGAMQHKDSVGHEEILASGDVQVMSAGSGLTHSEFNASAEEEVHFLQIWIFPNLKDVTPRYDQRSFKNKNGKLTPLVGPMDSDEDILKIHQDAYIYRLDIDAGEKAKYLKRNQDNGVYFFQQTGSSNILDEILNERDGFGIESTKEVEITGISKSEILVIEVPMF